MRHEKRLITVSVAALILVSLCAVCATTSVTAKDSIGAPPNGLDSGTAVCSWGPGRLDVFADGTNGHVWHTWWDGAWHSWEDLGAPDPGIRSNPTAVSWGPGRIDIFAQNLLGHLVHKWFEIGKGWSGWEDLYTPVGNGISYYTAPTACSWGVGRLDIFINGSDGQLWQKWFENGWQAWVPLGKPSTTMAVGSPGALSTVSWGYPRVDVFVRSSDGALWQLWWKNGWQAWHRFDDTLGLVASKPGGTAPSGTPGGYYGYFDYAPAVCSWGANRLDVFFVDNNGNLQQKWFNGAWQPLYQVGGPKYISAAPSAVAWQLGGTTRLDVFARGGDFALYQLYWAAGSGWNGWYDLGLLY